MYSVVVTSTLYEPVAVKAAVVRKTVAETVSVGPLVTTHTVTVLTEPSVTKYCTCSKSNDGKSVIDHIYTHECLYIYMYMCIH